MPHRMGRKPIREIIYELYLGLEYQMKFDLATMSFLSKSVGLVKIQKVVESETSLTNIEIVDKCFGPQCKSHVVGFGAGITAKELKGGNSSKTALLEMSNATEKEKESLKGRLEGLESKYDVLESKNAQLASVVFDQTSSPSSSEQ
ncbi:uncharacterized protein [Nicotiana sylvestris]|uniref:Uncharacterized protein LOC104223179 n=1 Tax=Nicotiana sylvestris TaxID=4096 RepID=A0A1U7WF47_NICSY|nr:PREDICTED: uncharacterized protein LOC104223179 [Nicotiana sylvestris]